MSTALNKYSVAFGAVIILSILLRFIWLDTLPPSLNWDEVSHGYNAYSILQTGKDEWGNVLPTIFRAYGDYKLPVYIYLTALTESILGLNILSVRIISVLAGIGTVVVTYLLVQKYIANKNVALLSSLIVAISPWSLFTSRAAFEANLGLFLVISGFYAFVSKRWIASAVLFGLSVWTYNSLRIFIPLFLFGLFISYRKEVKPLFWVIAALFIIPMVIQLLNPVGQARYENLQIINTGTIAYLEEQRNTSELPTLVTKLLYNKPVFFTGEVIKNYMNHFSPGYLFFEGSSDYQFNVPNHGLIYWSLLPFFYVGIVILLKRSYLREYRILLVWLLLAPIASSLTTESPHVLRSLVLIPLPMILIAMAIERTIKKPLVLVALLLFIIIQFGVYLKAYVSYGNTYSWSWQYGYEEVVQYISERHGEYDAVVMTKKYGEPHEFILFFSQWNPEAYRSDANLYRYEQSNWYWVDRFDSFYFVNDWEMPSSGYMFITERDIFLDCETIRCLLIAAPSNVPDGWNKLKVVNFLDGKPAFEIYEN